MMNSSFIQIHLVYDANEILLIHSVLSGSGIHYFIDNENYAFSSGFGLGIADDRMKVMVERSRAKEAIELLNKMINKKKHDKS